MIGTAETRMANSFSFIHRQNLMQIPLGFYDSKDSSIKEFYFRGA